MSGQFAQRTRKDPRFRWKAQVRRDHNLSRGARQFAGFVVDEYVYAGKTKFFAGNEVLAEGMGVQKRSIQRYVRELIEAGWLSRVRERGRRRTLELTSPRQLEGDSKSDSAHAINVTAQTREGDRVGTRIKKHDMNQESCPPQCTVVRTITIMSRETLLLENWNAWVIDRENLDWAKLLAALWNGQGYQFPSRHPPEEDSRAKATIEYFRARLRPDHG